MIDLEMMLEDERTAEDLRRKNGSFLDFPAAWIEDFRVAGEVARGRNEYISWLCEIIDEESYLPGEWVEWAPEVPIVGGRCCRCGETKEPDDFYPGRAACKECIRRSARRTWRKHREQYNARRRAK